MATRGSLTPAQWLYGLVAVTLAFKLWLSAVFPITGDEAYFIYWGAAPALGYYDHPPMVGWLLALLLKLSDAPWVLRLPITVLPAAMALTLYVVLRGRGGAGATGIASAKADAVNAYAVKDDADADADIDDRAALAAIGLLLVPVHVWNVFITTDTPLVLWSFLAGLAYWRAHSVGGSGDSGDSGDARVRRAGGQGSGWFVAAGVFLGLAFLSKYFAALLGIAFLAVVLASPRGQRRWRGFLITCAAALPFVAVNLYWNWEHCWANLMFNLYNRHGDAGWSWRTPALYAATVLYTLAPLALVALARDRGWLARLQNDVPLRVLVILGGLPFLLFAVLSSFKQVGLHWVLSFVPFFFAACALLLSRRALKASAIFLGAFSAIHVAIILVASTQPLERWQGNRIYDGAVFHFRIHDVLAELKPYEGEFELAADGYSAAVTASFYRGRYVFVFGEASSHARHDDIATDFRKFAGRNIAVLRKSPPRDEDYRPYFDAVEYKSFDVAGAKFHIVLGRGLNYAAYRDRVLVKVRDRYYRMPGYLPRGHCDFCERYFEGAACPVR